LQHIRLQQPLHLCFQPITDRGTEYAQSQVAVDRLALDIARITPEELRDRLNAGEDLFIVDLRSRIAESPNLIPGAKSISPEDLAARSKEIPRDRDIILFCS
jgi:hypothetical protein